MKNRLSIIFLIFIHMIFQVFCHATAGTPDLDLKKGSSWYQEAIQKIQEEEYEVSWQNNCAIPGGQAGYHMVNRKQNLRLYFYPEGVKAISRTESKPAWILGWSIAGISKGKSQSLEKPAIKAEKNLLEYNRGNLLEQYENLCSGVMARLVIQSPSIRGDSLNIKILLESDLIPGFEPGSSEIDFYMDGKAVAGFKNIRAQDADGNNLLLTTSLKDNEFQISVEDKEAEYPIDVNFLLVTPSPWSAESNKAEAEFGTSVRTAGDVNGDGYSDLIIGAPTYDNGEVHEGRAFVYYGSPNGPSPISNWVYESDQVDAQLGTSVSTAGDVNGDGYSDVIIGSINYTNNQAAEGGALVFYGSSTGLGTTFDLLEGNSTGSSFGCSVSTAGDVNGDGYSDVVVGAEFQYDDGKAYVFKGSADGIVKTPFWDYTSYLENARFGHSVCTAGDVNKDGYADIIIGSVIANNGQMGEGRAYVFHGGESEMTLKWFYESNMENWFLGSSVSTAGDVNGDGYSDVIVGVEGFENGEIAEGAAFIFHGSSTGLGGSPDRVIEPNVAGIFGNSVSTAGDIDGDGYADIIVGAHYYSDDYTYEGAAYIYRGSKNGIGETHSWFQKGNQAFAEFGYSVSTAGDVNGDGYSDVIIGAPYYDNGENREGKCFLYYGKPLPPSNDPDWNTENNVANCEFATSVARAGDVNSDGLSDIMVGAYLYDNGQTNEGRVFIYHGRTNDVPLTTANRTLEVNSANAYFGDCLAPAGDVNADGYDDIIIGAVGYNNFDGRVYIFHGSDTGIGTSPNLTIGPSFSGAHFGGSLSGADDVNGDGYSDVIIGSPYYSNGSARGLVHVFYGRSTGIKTTDAWIKAGDQDGSFFGYSVSEAGDVNGDGYSDVIIGANGYTNGQTDEGRAYVYYGSNSGVRSFSPWIAEPNQANAVYGTSVSTAGDVNGDGYSDVIIGASYYDNNYTNEGAAFIYGGSSNGLSPSPMIILDGANQDNAMFGHSVAAAGDVNGDGFSDVIVGAYKRDNRIILIPLSPADMYERPDAGSAYIYLGSPTGPSNTADWIEHNYQTDGFFGKCVAGAGDVNGDGFADVIIGAPGYSSSDIKYGRAYLYLGGGGNGREKKPLQGIGHSPFTKVSRLCKTDENNFTVGIKTFSPFGEGTLRFEFEIKEFPTPLDGTFTIITSPFNMISSISLLHKDYPENVLYHWRVRVLYDPVTIPYQPHGPWFSIPWNGIQEADFRIGPDSTPKLQDIINYLLGRSHYPHDINTDGNNDAADVVEFLIP